MDAAPWLADDEPIVGVVDPGSEAASPSGTDIAATIEATVPDLEGSIAAESVAEILSGDPSLFVAIGEAGLIAVARRASDVPVLPVGSVPGIESVAETDVADAFTALADGDAIQRRRPLLGVAGPGTDDRRRALFDVTLVTDEPARISEYAVESRDDAVAQFRADGVVVATPAGSHGYASAVDAPRLSPAIDAVAVAPIAPFTTATRRWVLPHADLVLSVERDEGDVRLLADGEPIDTVLPGERVGVDADGRLTTIVVPGISTRE
ncbi:NAD+ kinase [Halobiforma haloterrestris]|uniref:NAD+ kinase n=1 Tax=Natronobacterium haloterrestre TaxID=148448 RepID=A0A1I1DHS9_NATHA|nr:NAD(+)/NADH kinase [Halobiforma haloterrestris]SFB74384.1 NAD+ kinase [Halobiforma haloterrestris]